MKMDIKYHINPETGRANQCTATVKSCKYAQNGEIPQHYDSKEEAKLAYEKDNANKTFVPIKKEKPKTTKISQKNLPRYFHGATITEVKENIIKDYENAIMNSNYQDILSGYGFDASDYSIYSKNDVIGVLLDAYHTEWLDGFTIYDLDDDKVYLIADVYNTDVFLNGKDNKGEILFNNLAYVNDYDDGDEYYLLSLNNKNLHQVYNNSKVVSVLKNHYEASQKNLPDWAVLPRNSRNFSFSNDWKNIQSKVDLAEKAVAAAQKKLDDVQNNGDGYIKLLDERIQKAENLDKVVAKYEEGAKDHKEMLDMFSEKRREIAAKIEKYNKRKHTYIRNTDVGLLEAQLKDKKDRLLEAKKGFKNPSIESNYIKALASHHPSNNKNVAYQEAKKWFEENKNDIDYTWNPYY